MGNQNCALCKIEPREDQQQHANGLGLTPESSTTLLKTPSCTTEKRTKYDVAKDSPRATANATALTNAGSTSSATSFFGQFFRSDADLQKRRPSKPGAEILDMWQLNEESSESGSFIEHRQDQQPATDIGEPNTKKTLDVSEDNNRLSKSFDSSIAPFSSLNNDLLPKEGHVQTQEQGIGKQIIGADKRNDVNFKQGAEINVAKPGTPNTKRASKPVKTSRQAVLNKLIDSDNDSGEDDCSDEENEKILKKLSKGKDGQHSRPKPPSLEDQMKLRKQLIEFQKLQRMQQFHQIVGLQQFDVDESADETNCSQMLKTLYMQQIDNEVTDIDGAMTDIQDIEKHAHNAQLTDVNDDLEGANISRISKKSNSNLFFKRKFNGLGALAGNDKLRQPAERDRLLSDCLLPSDLESLQFSDIGGLDLQSRRRLGGPIGLLRMGMTTDDQGFTTNYDDATDNNDLRSMLRGFNGQAPQGILALGQTPSLRRQESHGFKPGFMRGGNQEDAMTVDLSMSECEKGVFMDFLKNNQPPELDAKHSSELAPINELPAADATENPLVCSALQHQEYPMPIRQNTSIPADISSKRIRRNSMRIDSTDQEQTIENKASTSSESDYATDEQPSFLPCIQCGDKKKVTLFVVLEAQKQAQLATGSNDSIVPRNRSSDETLNVASNFKPFASSLPNNTGGARKVLRPTFKEDQHAKSKKLVADESINTSEKRMPADDEEMTREYRFKSKHQREKKRKTHQTTMNMTTTSGNSPKGGSGAFAPRVALMI